MRLSPGLRPQLRSATVEIRDSRTSPSISALIEYVQSALTAQANPKKAAGMQSYMKTDMPFYGVQSPGLKALQREVTARFPLEDRDDYERVVLALWDLPHREEKYLAQRIASKHKKFIVPESMPIYRRFITEGQWWDFVDEAATHQVRELIRNHADKTWPEVDQWNTHEDMWLRRASIICQIGLKDLTDVDRLFRYCERRMHEQEFFVRKAIGWALREYAKTDPDAVAGFVIENRSGLSGLSFREATKHIGHLIPD